MPKKTGKLADALFGVPDSASRDQAQIKPTEVKSAPALGVSKALKRAHEFVSKPFGYENPPAEMISEFLGVPAVARTLERMAYGQPITNINKANVPLLPDDTGEAALAVAPLVGPLARAGKAAGKAGAKAVGSEINRAMLEGTGALSRLVPESVRPAFVVKPTKSGNWLTGSVERQLQPLKQTLLNEEGLRNLELRTGAENTNAYKAEKAGEYALNNWIDRNLTNYIKKEMATPEDPVRKLAEQGIVHKRFHELADPNSVLMQKRVGVGMPAKPMAQTPEGQFWENLADRAIDPYPAGAYKHGALDESILERNPWLAKTPDEEMVYSAKGVRGDLGFDHIIDVLREDLATGRIRPEQLSKVSMEQAVRRTAEYDRELAEKMAKATAAAREGLPVYKDYPEGYRWIELNRPGAFASESEAMGHSVRGYEPPKGHPDWTESSGDSGSLGYGHGGWEAIKSGQAKVYSLVDPKGQPHVTVEVKAKPTYTADDVIQQFPGGVTDAMKAGDVGGQNYIAKKLAEMNSAGADRITQIKGKQNQAPNEEYLPFVQDFVRSGQWSDVGDLKNTGLFKVTPGQKLPGFSKEISPGYYSIDDFRKMAVENEMPQDILDSWMSKLEERSRYGYKTGGAVHFSDNPDAMRLELAGGGLVKGLKAAVKAVKGEAQVVKEAPSIIIPSKVSNVMEAVRQSKGDYGAKRVQRAADEVQNLERMFQEQALRQAFMGDNAKAMATIKPQDFEKFAEPLERSTDFRWGYSKDLPDMTQQEYLDYLMKIEGGFSDVPYLELNKARAGEPGTVWVSGHEGRHRNRALANRGENASIVQILPRAELREPLPRRSQEEYIEALRKELGPKVRPQQNLTGEGPRDRPPIDMPDIYAKGGAVSFADNPDVMRLEMAGGGAVTKLARLLRAPAKTPAEIEAIAQRMAPQVTGEYVRAKPGSAVTVAGKTKKQFEKEKTLPVDIRAEKGERVPEPVDIEKLKGEVMIGIPGDPTVTGKTLHSVGDVRLESPSPQHGGPLYGLYHDDDHFWASGIGAARRVQNLTREASQQYDAPVVGKYIMMGPDSINYAQHFADANLQAIDLSKMTQKQIDTFNELIRRGSPKSGPRPNFPGIEDKGDAYLQMAFDPELRKHFNALMQQPTITEPLNLPSGTDIRFAITEPSLRDLETGVTGFSMGRMRPDIPSEGLKLSEHPTYSHDIPGHFLGSTKYPVPYELSFPDTLKAIRENPRQAPQEFGSLKMVGPRQIIDQQMIDELKAYEDQMKKLTGKKKGGEVAAPAAFIDGNEFVLAAKKYGLSDDMVTLNKMVSLVNQGANVDEAARVVAGGAVKKASGGEISADDLTIEERPL